jgi:nitroreductase
MVAYFHVDEALIRAPARSCFELVLAVRRYGEWWRKVRCEPLGPEGILRVGSRFRLGGGPVSWVVEVTGLDPFRRIDLRYAEGDMLGPVRWEFAERDDATLVRYAYRGVRPNSDYTADSFASGRSLRLHRELMQSDAFAGMRRLLESGYDVSGGDLFEAIHTLGAVRRFRPDPVPDALVEQVVAAATRAASARNTQPWRFVAVRDAGLKARIGELYLRAWRAAQSYTRQANADADIDGRPDYDRMMRSVDDLAVHLGESPVLILACLDTRELGPLADGAGTILSPQSAYASIFPAVQNLMLAARGLGLGTTLTTLHAAFEGEIRALLGIPGHVHVAALIPLGYPRAPFRVTKRKPVRGVLHYDRWPARSSDEQ